jgi:hypothetical protein
MRCLPGLLAALSPLTSTAALAVGGTVNDGGTMNGSGCTCDRQGQNGGDLAVMAFALGWALIRRRR